MSKHVISTKLDKDSDAVSTTLEINWDGCTEEVLRRFATAALIVKLQARFRSQKQVPSTITVNAVEMAPGTRGPKASPIETLLAQAKNDPALKAKILAQLAESESESE